MSDGSPPTSWQPSENQRRVLSVFQGHDYDITVSDACREAVIDRTCYYDWHDNPEFSQWWKDQANHFLGLQLHDVYSKALVSARGGDVKGYLDRKLFLERFDRDYCPKGRQELSGPGGGAIPLQIVMFGTPPEADPDPIDETDPGDAAAGA